MRSTPHSIAQFPSFRLFLAPFALSTLCALALAGCKRGGAESVTKTNDLLAGPDPDFPGLELEFDAIATRLARNDSDVIERAFGEHKDARLKELHRKGGPQKRLAISKIMYLVAAKVQEHADTVHDAEGERSMLSLDQVRYAIALQAHERFGLVLPNRLVSSMLKWWDEEAVKILKHQATKGIAVLSLKNPDSHASVGSPLIQNVDSLSDITGMAEQNYQVEDALNWKDTLPRKSFQIKADTVLHEVVLIEKQQLILFLRTYYDADGSLTAREFFPYISLGEDQDYPRLKDAQRQAVDAARSYRDAAQKAFAPPQGAKTLPSWASEHCRMDSKEADLMITNALRASLHFLSDKLRLGIEPRPPALGDERNTKAFETNSLDWTRYGHGDCR